jgi:acetolactate synthase-1/3 small subunit
VDNHAGVLSRVSGLFSRRGYNIDSLSVGETENPKISRITVAVTCDDIICEQIRKQVDKLVDVRKVTELPQETGVYRELALIKISVNAYNRMDIIGIAGVFRADVVDVSPESVMLEITGDERKISALMRLMEPYGIISAARTGMTALGRGDY